MTEMKNLRLLVVEDDVDYNDVICEIMGRKFKSVLSATNGKEALDILAANPVDVVISDVQMPVMDGIALVEKLRLFHKDIPVILLATGQSQLNAEKAKLIGANGLIHKPFTTEEITQMLEKLVENIVAP